MQSVLLITGWGVGVEPLQHLQQQLRGAGCVAEVINIFDAADPIAFQATLAKVQHYDVLAGWSLGGNWPRYWHSSFGNRRVLPKP